MGHTWWSGTPWPCVTFPSSVAVSTLQTSLSWETLCVKHCRRRHGRDAKGWKQQLSSEGLPHSHILKIRFLSGLGQATQTIDSKNPNQCVHLCNHKGNPPFPPSCSNMGQNQQVR